MAAVMDARAGSQTELWNVASCVCFFLGELFCLGSRSLSLGRERFRSQVRLLGLAALVGIVAGLGAIVFYVSTRVVEHYALGVVAGYSPSLIRAANRRFRGCL